MSGLTQAIANFSKSTRQVKEKAVAQRLHTTMSEMFTEMSANGFLKFGEKDNLPTEVLQTLAVHPDSAIREAAAGKTRLPLSALLVVLWTLTTHDSVEVRHTLAANHNLPESVLAALATDNNLRVACRALRSLHFKKRMSSQDDSAYDEKCILSLMKSHQSAVNLRTKSESQRVPPKVA